MSAHTGRPWAVSKEGSAHMPGIVVSKDNIEIASAWEEANARLIAAAPDLLEALRELSTQHKCGCGHPYCNNCERDKMAEQAIAKATGETE